jgi:hypothetical protein
MALLESEIEKGGTQADLDFAVQTLRNAVDELGQFGIRGTRADEFEVVGKDWMDPAVADAEWSAYRSHRKRIAEATLRLVAH